MLSQTTTGSIYPKKLFLPRTGELIQDMEKAVSRRDTIVTRGDAQSKLYKKVETKGTFQKKLTETRKKIKQTQQVGGTQHLKMTTPYNNHVPCRLDVKN